MTVSLVTFVTVQGVGSSDGQYKICYPSVPTSHASDPEYVVGLAERPTVDAAVWDPIKQRTSIGGFSLSFIDDGAVGFRWANLIVEAINVIVADADVGDSTIDVLTDPTGLANGTNLYSGVETMRVTNTQTSPNRITCSFARGLYGSTELDLKAGHEIYLKPPALVGRAITIYETPAEGGTETVVARGYIESEPSMGLFWPSIRCQATWWRAMIGAEASTIKVTVAGGAPRNSLPGSAIPAGVTQTGGYWMAQNGSVWRAHYDSGESVWEFGSPEDSLMHGDTLDSENASETGLQWFSRVLYSRTDGSRYFPPFGRDSMTVPGVPDGSWVASDHPIDIALNLLLTSSDGSNYGGSDDWTWDLGTFLMYPAYGLAIARSNVDLDEFERQRARYPGVHADRLWISEPENIWDLLNRILFPLGLTCGTGRTGTVSLFRLRDAYPGGATITCSPSANMMSDGLSMQGRARAVDSVTLEVEPDPEGRGTGYVVQQELGGRSLYPSQVGSAERFKNIPYSLGQFEDYAVLALVAANRVRRTSDTSAVIKYRTNPTDFNNIDIATRVTIYDPKLIDPTTGLRMTSAIQGQVTRVSADMRYRQLSVEAVVMASINTALYAPGAFVEGFVAGTKTFTVTDSLYGGSPSDAETFEVDDYIRVVDANFASASTTLMKIVTVTATTIIVDSDPTAGGYTYAAGDHLVPAYWDESAASQRASGYACCADGGSASTAAPSLGSGGDAPYVYGD